MDNKKINQPPPRGGFYYNNELFFSKAYEDLTVNARRLLHLLINELRWDRLAMKKERKKVYTNNGEVSFTQSQFQRRYNCVSDTYLNARNQLITNGLIKMAYRGGHGKGDRSQYKVLCVEGVPQAELRWLLFPKNNWENEIPKVKNNPLGKKTQFKKGQSGRKLKSTLKK